MFNSPLTGKHVLLGITGGIAAYKTPDLVRLLKKSGAEVKVILSQGAHDFVTPLSLETVSENPVYQSCAMPGHPMLHIDLARWADIYLIAPLSANKLAALVHGFADDLLTTTYLATTAPVWVAPAMNKQMWEHAATVSNIKIMSERAKLLGPEQGIQACQDVGFGRMMEPVDMVQALEQSFCAGVFQNKTIMITAGPTREPIDPVRFLSNRSSGKMGYQLAAKAAAMGAKVILVSGPVSLEQPRGVGVVLVQTALEMYEAVIENLQGVDIFIGTAAVADYRLKDPKASKIKKQKEQPLELSCIQNPDILSTVACQSDRPFCVGFAAETDHGEHYAKAKLRDKGIDMIALNVVDRPGVGFEGDTNALTVYWADQKKHLPLASKASIAEDLLKQIYENYHEKENFT